MKKKIFAVILTVCMIMTMIPMNAFAENTDRWHMIFSETEIDKENPPQEMGTSIRMVGTTAEKNVYLYIAKKADRGFDTSTITPVTTETFNIKYLRGEKDNRPDHINNEGITITKIKDNNKDNYYRISIDNSKQTDYTIGTGYYDVWPEMTVENVVFGNSVIDTNRESRPMTILSTKEKLDTVLTGEQVADKNNYNIINKSFVKGVEDEITGYLYIAIQELEDDESWAYKKIEKMTADVTPVVMYRTNQGKNEVVSKDLTCEVRTDQDNNVIATFKYTGANKDEGIEEEGEYFVNFKNSKDAWVGSELCIRCNSYNIEDPNKDKTYQIRLDKLEDPADYSGNLYNRHPDEMWHLGQGNAVIFNSKIKYQYTCFYVIDADTERDARGVRYDDGSDVRFYIGNANDFVIEARAKDTNTWVKQEALSTGYQLFSMTYEPYRKGYDNVFKIDFDLDKDDTNKATEKYDYRLRYTGNDPYLNNENKENNMFVLSLDRDENMDEFDIDEYRYDANGRYNSGNVQYFDTIGAGIKTKLVIRPGVLRSVADKKVYSVDDYIFVENEANNITFYKDTDNGFVALSENESPFTVKWDAQNKWYDIVYNHPERDLYGPSYGMSYTGDYNSKINEKYNDTGNHKVTNRSEFFTGKFTVDAKSNDIDATVTDKGIKDRINTIGVIFGKGSINGKAEIKIKADEGNITIGGELSGNIGEVSGNVSFEMRDLLKDDYGLTDAQKEVVEKCRKAFDFKITDEDQKDIAFGDDGYAEIEIPCDIQGMAIYYIDESGNKTLISSTYENGKLKFTAKHFSTYVVAPYENTGGGTTGGGAVMPPAADEDDVKTTTDNTTSEIKTSTTVKDTKTETVKNEQGEDISKVTATISEKVADNLVEQAVSNKSDTVEITVKSNDGNKAAQTEVEIPKKAVESIAKDTNADLVIKTDSGQVTLDNKTLETIAEEAEGDTVKITVNENTQLKEEQKPASDVIGKNGKLFDLKAVIGDKILHDFKGGKAHVILPMPEKLKGKDIVIIYINDKGICEILNHTMETVGAEEYIKFTTSHFSNFAVVEKADAEKIIAKQNADKINSLIREAKLKATTSKTTKKSIKVKIGEAKNSNSLIKEAKAIGYTVKYKFYRSTKKSSKYIALKTKDTDTYINTAGKKGTKYYYKAMVLVYDGKTLIAQTELKQCRYGVRSWNK